MIPNMINIILALLKYYRSNSSFLTFCAGYRSHYVCNDVSIWFAYKWSKMLTKKLSPCLKWFSIFQLTKCHQKTSVFTKCPRDPQKWTIAPALTSQSPSYRRHSANSYHQSCQWPPDPTGYPCSNVDTIIMYFLLKDESAGYWRESN